LFSLNLLPTFSQLSINFRGDKNRIMISIFDFHSDDISYLSVVAEILSVGELSDNISLIIPYLVLEYRCTQSTQYSKIREYWLHSGSTKWTGLYHFV